MVSLPPFARLIVAVDSRDMFGTKTAVLFEYLDVLVLECSGEMWGALVWFCRRAAAFECYSNCHEE